MTDAGFVAVAWLGTAGVLGAYGTWLWLRIRRLPDPDDAGGGAG